MDNFLMIIKPDAVEAGQMGSIISRIENMGFLKIQAVKLVQMDRDAADQLYNIHSRRNTYEGLMDFMVKGKSLVLILGMEGFEGGYPDMLGFLKEIFRQEFASNKDVYSNAIHLSDNLTVAEREIEIFF